MLNDKLIEENRLAGADVAGTHHCYYEFENKEVQLTVVSNTVTKTHSLEAYCTFRSKNKSKKGCFA